MVHKLLVGGKKKKKKKNWCKENARCSNHLNDNLWLRENVIEKQTVPDLVEQFYVDSKLCSGVLIFFFFSKTIFASAGD